MRVEGRSGNYLEVNSLGGITAEVRSNDRSWERSARGKLFGVGTGFVDLPEGFSGALLRWENITQDQVLFVQKLIFGWDGGDVGQGAHRFRPWVVRSLIHYGQSTPTAGFVDNQAMGNENQTKLHIKPQSLISSQVWDGLEMSGMSLSGGYPAIPNTIGMGNLSIPIDGEIVIGPGNSQTFHVTPEQPGTFHLAVVFYCMSSSELATVLGGVDAV